MLIVKSTNDYYYIEIKHFSQYRLAIVIKRI